MNSFVPSASPIKFATVFGASFSSNRITIFPCEVSKIAYVPAARAMRSPFFQCTLIVHEAQLGMPPCKIFRLCTLRTENGQPQDLPDRHCGFRIVLDCGSGRPYHWVRQPMC